MKNLLTLLLALGFVIGMTACGGTTTTEESDAAEGTEQVEGAAEEMDAVEAEATGEEMMEEEATEEEATEEEATEEEAEEETEEEGA